MFVVCCVCNSLIAPALLLCEGWSVLSSLFVFVHSAHCHLHAFLFALFLPAVGSEWMFFFFRREPTPCICELKCKRAEAAAVVHALCEEALALSIPSTYLLSREDLPLLSPLPSSAGSPLLSPPSSSALLTPVRAASSIPSSPPQSPAPSVPISPLLSSAAAPLLSSTAASAAVPSKKKDKKHHKHHKKGKKGGSPTSTNSSSSK